MNNSINLISTKNEQLERELRALILVRVIAVSLLITLAVVSIVAFLISTQIPISKLKQEENNTLTNISTLHSKLTTYYLIKDRINNINNLLNLRKDYSNAIDLLFSKVGSDMTVESISVEKGEIKFQVSGDSLVSINKTIDDVFSEVSKGKIITKVELSSLSLDARRGKYSLVLTAQTGIKK